MSRKTKTRKKPVRHRVATHKREGSTVESYMRGTRVLRVKPIVTISRYRKSREPKAWTVNFKYSNKTRDGESFLVIAPTYQRALDEAFEEKKDLRDPIELSVIDPTIGEVLHLIGRGAKQAAHLGAKYAIKGGKAVAKGGKDVAVLAAKKGGSVLAARLRDEIAKGLIKDAYGTNRGARIIARSRLKAEYPNVYNVMDFSRRYK